MEFSFIVKHLNGLYARVGFLKLVHVAEPREVFASRPSD